MVVFRIDNSYIIVIIIFFVVFFYDYTGFISEYLFCPFKVYFMGKTDLENTQRNRLFREAYSNFKDFVRDLLPLINKEMGVSEIEDLLRKLEDYRLQVKSRTYLK